MERVRRFEMVIKISFMCRRNGVSADEIAEQVREARDEIALFVYDTRRHDGLAKLHAVWPSIVV
jgi:hypothetical protein